MENLKSKYDAVYNRFQYANLDTALFPQFNIEASYEQDDKCLANDFFKPSIVVGAKFEPTTTFNQPSLAVAV